MSNIDRPCNIRHISSIRHNSNHPCHHHIRREGGFERSDQLALSGEQLAAVLSGFQQDLLAW